MIRRHWRNVEVEPVEPLPPLQPPEWMADGICARLGWAEWDCFTVPEQVAICHDCPVMMKCREFGIETIEATSGKDCTVVYGGLEPTQIVTHATARRTRKSLHRGRTISAALSGAETPTQGLTRSTSITAKEGLMPHSTQITASVVL